MKRESTFYARPESAARARAVYPRLASWNAAGHPGQMRVSAALDDAEAVLVSGPETYRENGVGPNDLSIHLRDRQGRIDPCISTALERAHRGMTIRFLGAVGAR